MHELEVDDMVYIKSTRLVGQVLIVKPEGRFEVHSQGHINNYGLADLEKVEPQDVAIINHAIAQVAVAIDNNYGEESYSPVYNEEGQIIFSNAAAAALTAIDYVRLVIELRRLGEEVNDYRAMSPRKNG